MSEAMQTAVNDPANPATSDAVERAVDEGLKPFCFHLREPPWNELDGVLLSAREHAEVVNLLRQWLFIALEEFSKSPFDAAGE